MPKRVFPLIALFALAAGCVSIRAQKPTPTPSRIDDPNEVIKVETNLVTMPVSVLDRDGRFIGGLQQRDFKIFENGVEQKIDYFQSVEQPFTVIMLIDVSPSTQFRIEEIQNAAISFLDQLRPNDRVMIIAFDDNVHVLSPITNNRNMLRAAIRRTEFGDGTSLYDAVQYAIDNELRHIDGRKTVVLFSDGVDTTSRHANFDSTLRNTEELDALFYTLRYDTSRDMNGGWGGGGRSGNRGVSMGDILGAIILGGSVGNGGGGWGRGGRGGGGMGQSPAEYEKGRRYLEGLAANSGGREFEAQSMYNVDAAFQGIAEELRRQDERETRLMLLAHEDGVLVGSGLADRSDSAGTGSVAPRVLPGFRRRRIGTALLEQLAEHLEAHDLLRVRATVDDDDSLAFAHCQGFQDTDHEVRSEEHTSELQSH